MWEIAYKLSAIESSKSWVYFLFFTHYIVIYAGAELIRLVGRRSNALPTA